VLKDKQAGAGLHMLGQQHFPCAFALPLHLSLSMDIMGVHDYLLCAPNGSKIPFLMRSSTK
jgi:hypothetical protein